MCSSEKIYLTLRPREDIRNWEQSNADIALHETNRELESQRLELHQADQWADQAQREKISLFGELDMRNRIFHENRQTYPEIEELRRTCCKEIDRARQLRTDELILCEAERDSMFCESALDSDSGLAEQREFLV